MDLSRELVAPLAAMMVRSKQLNFEESDRIFAFGDQIHVKMRCCVIFFVFSYVCVKVAIHSVQGSI